MSLTTKLLLCFVSIYLEIQEAPAKNPAQNSSNKQLGKIEDQIQAAPPCGKESGYSVLNHLAMVHVAVNFLAPSICGTLKDKAGLIFF